MNMYSVSPKSLQLYDSDAETVGDVRLLILDRLQAINVVINHCPLETIVLKLRLVFVWDDACGGQDTIGIVWIRPRDL